jgi:glycine/D-amino acid oxidase-like deaminating enzyme
VRQRRQRSHGTCLTDRLEVNPDELQLSEARPMRPVSSVGRMSGSRAIRVAVIGAGITGVSAAHQLALAGAETLLITEAGLASGASGRSLSWLNSAGPYGDRYHRLRMAAIDRYRTLVSRQPDARWLRFAGGLRWHSEDPADLLRQHEDEIARGYDSRLLSRDQVSGLVQGVEPAAVPDAGAIWNPGEGWVDLPSLIDFLADDFRQHGGRLISDAGQCHVTASGGVATGVRTANGESNEADVVLLAAGAAVPELAAELGVTIPDATEVAMLVTTERVEHDLEVVLNTPRASLRPTPDGALVVDSEWASAQVTQADDGSYQVPEDVVESLLAEASPLLRGSPRLKAARRGMGRKPIPADGEPVLGRIDEIEHLWVAFTHSGATLGLISGELLAYEIDTGKPHPMLADFNARRFR